MLFASHTNSVLIAMNWYALGIGKRSSRALVSSIQSADCRFDDIDDVLPLRANQRQTRSTRPFRRAVNKAFGKLDILHELDVGTVSTNWNIGSNILLAGGCPHVSAQITRNRLMFCPITLRVQSGLSNDQ
jgi:hypothetical protein